MKKRTIFFLGSMMTFLKTMHVSYAANESTGFIFDNPISKGTNIFALVHAILDFVVKIGTIAVIFMVIYSGFLFVKAQGDSGAIIAAKDTFFWTVIGGVVLIGAKVLATVICNTAVGLGATIQCGLI